MYSVHVHFCRSWIQRIAQIGRKVLTALKQARSSLVPRSHLHGLTASTFTFLYQYNTLCILFASTLLIVDYPTCASDPDPSTFFIKWTQKRYKMRSKCEIFESENNFQFMFCIYMYLVEVNLQVYLYLLHSTWSGA